MPYTNIGEEYGPYSQYLARYGLGQGYQNPAQTYLEKLYNPLRSLWQQQQLVGVGTGQGTPGWPDYFEQFGPVENRYGGRDTGFSVGGLRNQAARTLQQLLGLTPARRQETGLNYEPTYDPLTGSASYGAGAGIGDLQDLMTLGLANKYGQMGAGYAAGRLPYMQQQWQLGQAGAQAGGGAQQTFLDYIRQKYGI